MFSDKIGLMIEATMKQSLQKYNSAEDELRAWDSVQTSLSCCGLNNLTDWQILANISWIPESCLQSSGQGAFYSTQL